MSSQTALRWRSVSPDAIVWHEWNDEYVVRNELTGSTHLLGPLAGRVLQVLLHADGAMSMAQIAGRLGDLTAGDEADPFFAIETVLSEFVRLGLAEADKQ
jgi:PqqD family protein of HPr-rel-A system